MNASERRQYWIHCKNFETIVVVDNGIVMSSTSPRALRFVGQPILNLIGWAQGFGDFRMLETETML